MGSMNAGLSDRKAMPLEVFGPDGLMNRIHIRCPEVKS